MNEYSFKVKFDLAPDCLLSCDAKSLTLLDTPEGQRVEIVSLGDCHISKCSELALQSHNWATIEDAKNAGTNYLNALKLTLVGNKIGVDLWARRGESGITHEGQDFFRKMLGLSVDHAVICDQSGRVEVFKTTSPPTRISMGAKLPLRVVEKDIISKFNTASSLKIDLTVKDEIAIDLFNSSFFESSAHARFLTLVMAVESLVELKNRPISSLDIVSSFEQQIKESSLEKSEIASIAGSLKWLKKESIRSGCANMATCRLGNKTYEDKSPSKFILDCYDIRSKLVHGGGIRTARSKISSKAAILKEFVSDLILNGFKTG